MIPARDVVVVGAGFVGLATAVALVVAGHRVTVLDADRAKVADLLSGRVPFHEPDMDAWWERAMAKGAHVAHMDTSRADEAMAQAWATFVCVPTLTTDNGEQDTAPLRDVAQRWVAAVSAPENSHLGSDRWGHFVIRSTVLPSTIETIEGWMSGWMGDLAYRAWGKLVHVPEFLAEGTALRDALNPVRIVAGWARPDLVPDEERWNLLLGMMPLQEFVPMPSTPKGEGGEISLCGTRLLDTDAPTAAMLKYASNAMLASRLSMLQEIAMVCGKVGADVLTVSKGLAADPRIGDRYLSPGAGWGGSCFGKDVRALAGLAACLEVEPEMLAAATRGNASASRWLSIEVGEAAARKLATLKRRVRIAWLGLAFKPGTSDLRESPSVDALEWVMVTRGFSIEVMTHDPKARDLPSEWSQPVKPPPVASSAVDACRGADVIVLATAWPEYGYDLPGILQVAADAPIVIDGRNLWSWVEPRHLPRGAVYVPFGRPKVLGGGV